MAVIRTPSRKRMKDSTFGLPGERKYPMPDKAHAVNAEARATQMVKKGKLSPAKAAQVRAKARSVLNKGE